MVRRPGFYERRIFPWVNDKLTNDPELLRLRAEQVARARGRVVEIGFGTGANLPHYPAAVEAVTGVEPNPGMIDRSEGRTRAFTRPLEIVEGAAEQLPLPDGAFDTAVSTLTLCSVADAPRALAELRRVLKSDGQLIVLEHGLSPDPRIARWQHRLNPLERIVAAGCNLDRPIADLVRHAGFDVQHLTNVQLPGAPRTHGWFTMGAAVPA
jgi:SAM-dependent methyltransferase